jgi:hypothetical protein
MNAPVDVAGVSLAVPRQHYDIARQDGGSATLAREHPARALEGAALTVRLAEGDVTATFEMKAFAQPAVQPYTGLPPATTWRALLVEHGLLGRPELVWAGAFPAGWDQGLDAPQATALSGALGALHRRYVSLVRPASADFSLRQLECAECRAARIAKLPPNQPAWRTAMTQPLTKCPHAEHAMRALGELCSAYPELTFELLGWIEPAGARVKDEGPPPSRFVLTGLLVEALLGPWLVGEELRTLQRSMFRAYDTGRRTYQPDWSAHADPRRTSLHRGQRAAIALAASAWGIAGTPETLVRGNDGAPAPALDPAAAPPIEATAALPGAAVKRRAARARRAGRAR